MRALSLLFAVLGIGFGFTLGGVFGAAEHQVKDYLKNNAAAVADSVYQGDELAMAQVTSKAWSYMKRAHLHGGAIGAAAVALCLLLAFLSRPKAIVKTLASLALGLGALGYPMFWLLAACRAPTLGSTTAAKESLFFLAATTSGLILLGWLSVFILLAYEVFRPLSTQKTS